MDFEAGAWDWGPRAFRMPSDESLEQRRHDRRRIVSLLAVPHASFALGAHSYPTLWPLLGGC